MSPIARMGHACFDRELGSSSFFFGIGGFRHVGTNVCDGWKADIGGMISRNCQRAGVVGGIL